MSVVHAWPATVTSIALVIGMGCSGASSGPSGGGTASTSAVLTGPPDSSLPLTSPATTSATSTSAVEPTNVVGTITPPTSSLGELPVCDGYEDASSSGTLRLCLRGARVEELQSALVALDFPVDVDGAFGPSTELAVRRFQCSYGLVVDGLAGPATLATVDLALQALEAGTPVTTVARGCGG